MPPFALEAWIGPLVRGRHRAEGGGSDARLTLGCPTAFHRDRVRERFLSEIERCAALEAGVPVAVDLVVAPPLRATAPAPAQPRARDQRAAARPARDRTRSGRSRATRPIPSASSRIASTTSWSAPATRSRARRRSRSRADAQRALNPLVLAAAQGLGKTHLARAIVNEARQNGEARVIYASAESFTNEFTHSIQARRADEFKRRFRHGCRLLVIEDVQFLDARKRATQLELFHTICHLLDVGARVVLTADRLPRDIEGLDPRLRSKLSSGLVAELEAPDAIVRREILRQKAADGGVRLPDACRELIVESVRGSVRDLEGVLIQLVATASLLKRPIDAELTLVALRKLAPIAGVRRALEIGDVVASVAAYFKQRARRARRSLAPARRAAAAPARDVPGPPLHERVAVGDRSGARPRPLRRGQRGAQDRAPDPGARAAALPGRGAVRATRRAHGRGSAGSRERGGASRRSQHALCARPPLTYPARPMIARIFLALSGLVWFPYGVYLFFQPGYLADAAGIVSTTATGNIELRAMYGGLQAGIGALAFAGALRPALDAAGAVRGVLPVRRAGALALARRDRGR